MQDDVTHSESQWSLHIPTFLIRVAQSLCVLYYSITDLESQQNVSFVNWPIKTSDSLSNMWDFILVFY